VVDLTLAGYPRLREVDLFRRPEGLFYRLSCFILNESAGRPDRPAYCDIGLEEQLGIGYCDSFEVVE
jgi:hypothetical protein